MAEQQYDAIVVGSGISGGWAAKELTEKITPEEKIIKKLLKECKIKFEFQKPIVCIGFRNKYVLYILDFYRFDLTD